MRSYEDHPAASTRLVVAVKGFREGEVPAEYLDRLAPHGSKVLPLEDTGFDIGSYWATARALTYGSYCFSIPSASSSTTAGSPRWPGVTVPPLASSVPVAPGEPSDRRRAPAAVGPLPTPGGLPGSLPVSTPDRQGPLWLIEEWRRQVGEFPPFPNPHIRTNAFLIRRDLMLEVEVGDNDRQGRSPLVRKRARSLTRRSCGGAPVLVVRPGRVAYPQRTGLRATLPLRNQANLMVSDNRGRGLGGPGRSR